ncbi:UBX domain-containing protein 1 [Tribolium castaneum]|uniref:UBX domain-containing protein 1-like Protein n=1 Tax=Tribolium castaneum TaxID=7070 RepID=D6X342_TRICA|nr:PREDICTED: UBX domain-containing protein 1 [Tribolium castaneum]EFA10323.1 UBX domain-containing protein 1-like Protein [Tribolium castaneum]|eukprot:XP_970144.1 PREDICTED: UBX domain-containing protein 1 [Tribolium castaneum]
MSGTVDTLVEMGFSKARAELAVSKTGTEDIQVAMDWLLSHEEELEDMPEPPQAADASAPEAQPSPEGQVVRSFKCDDCGKLFKSQDEVEFHATKSGHEHFSESTEEKKPLTEEEKKEQLAKIEAKLKQRRMEREAREKQEALEKERSRIKSGKELLEAKKKHDEIEMKKLVEQRKREKEEERLARQRVKEQIEQDKLARKAKFSGQPLEEAPQAATPAPQPAAPKPAAGYSEVMLQIRLTNGSSLVQKFGAKEPLSAVRLYVEMNRKDGEGPFSLMTNYPKKVFGPEDYDVPLESLGLGPRATLIVSKS